MACFKSLLHLGARAVFSVHRGKTSIFVRARSCTKHRDLVGWSQSAQVFAIDDPMQDRDNWCWQATAMSMKERTTYLWKNNPVPFNVTFEVGPAGKKEPIGAHRDILAISSGVFYSMFYGPLAKPRDSQNDPVVDEDINPEAFRLMLEFIYTESIGPNEERRRRESENKPFPEVELAFKTMQAAGKYGIPALYLFCRNYILGDIQKTFETSKGVAEYGLLYAIHARKAEWINKPIVEAVWREIDAFTEAVLQVPDQVLRTVDESLMVEFISRTSLNVSEEIMLYNFAVRWARLQLEGPRRGETLKNVIGNLVKVLRLSRREWLDGPVKDGLCNLDDQKLPSKAASVAESALRRAPDPPAIIRFDIVDTREHGDAEYSREGDLGQIEIQTQTENHPVLTKLIEKCVRKQMERNDGYSPCDLSIDLVYKLHDLYFRELYEDDQISLNKEELDMLNNGGRMAAQMKLGLGDVAAGFVLASERRGAGDMLGNMYLVFGDDSGQPYYRYPHDANNTRLFYVGRLTTGQDYLDDWDRNPYGRTILYDVTYEKKSPGPDAPARLTLSEKQSL